MISVKYRVCSDLGYYSIGSVIEAQLYLEGFDNEAIIYHAPYCEEASACLEICVKGSDGIYYSKHEDSWINVSCADIK